MESQALPSRSLRLGVQALFVVSGATALLYQVTWVRDLMLILGASFEATAIVLASFMAGLSLGSFVLGRRADSLARPLRVYAWLEIGIALAACALPFALDAADAFYVGAAKQAGGAGAGLATARVAMAFGLLVVPTFFMGGTLPVLIRWLLRGPEGLESLGHRLAWLYGLNTLGGLLGALAAGFVLIPTLGVWHTQLSAVIVNLAIGAVAWSLDAWETAKPSAAPEPDPTPTESHTWFAAGAYRVAFFGTAVGGFSSLALEVMWTRAIGLHVGSTTYSFTVMLASFLVGIWLGSWLRPFLPSRRLDPASWLGIVMMGAGITSLLASEWIPVLPDLVIRANLALHGDLTQVRPSTTLLVSFVVMWVPCLFMGMAFPLAAEVRSRLANEAGASVGDTLSLNTLGTIAGSLTAGFVWIPWLGLQRGMLWVSVLPLAYGALILACTLAARVPKRRALVAVGFAAVLALVLALPSVPRGWDRDLLGGFNNNRLGRYVKADGSVDVAGALELGEVVYLAEGRVSNVSVLETRGHLAILINGKVVASSNQTDMQLQLLMGHVPALLHEDPRDALVVGLGAGVTAGALSAHPGIEKLRIVEIEPEVAGGTRVFGAWNDHVLDDPRVELVIQDGRNHLKTTEDTFDIITADPIHPWAHGAAYLYTREYYALVQERLRPGGLACQWLPADELSLEDFQSIVTTFAEVFEHVVLWQSRNDVVLMGGDAPIRADLPRLAERLMVPQVRDQLAPIARDAPLPFLADLTLAGDATARFVRGGIVNTDDNLYLEFAAPRNIGVHGMHNLVALQKLRVSLLDWVGGTAHFFGPEPNSQDSLERVREAKSRVVRAFALASAGRQPAARRLLEEALAKDPSYTPARRELAELRFGAAADALAQGRAGFAVAETRAALELWPQDAAGKRLLGVALEATGDRTGAIDALEAARQGAPRDWFVHDDLSRLLVEAGRVDEARRVVAEGLALRPGHAAMQARLRALEAAAAGA